MSMDNSLKSGSNLTKHRNVLTRTERIAKLSEKGSFDLADSDPLGLVKVGNRKVVTATKVKKAKGDDEDAAADDAAKS